MRVARLANRAGLGKLAGDIGGCSHDLALDAQGRVVGRRACRRRECPLCAAARSAEWGGRLRDAMPVLVAEHADWVPLLLTLTVRSVPLDRLRETLTDLHAAVKRLTLRAQWAPLGWVRATEVTIRPDGYAHPHCHILALVPASYFAAPWRKDRGPNGRPKIVPGYMRHAEWRDLWQDCARLDYRPVVDVRRVRGSLADATGRHALYEVSKYAAKPADVLKLTGEHFAALHGQMCGLRCIAVGGVLRTYLGEPPDEDGDGDELPDAAAVASWDAGARRYRPADAATTRAVQADRAALRDRLTPWGRALAARAAARNGLLLAEDYAAAALLRRSTPPRPATPAHGTVPGALAPLGARGPAPPGHGAPAPG